MSVACTAIEKCGQPAQARTSDAEHHPFLHSSPLPVPITASSKAGLPPLSPLSPPPAPPRAQQTSALPAPPPPPAAPTKRCPSLRITEVEPPPPAAPLPPRPPVKRQSRSLRISKRAITIIGHLRLIPDDPSGVIQAHGSCR